MAFFFWTFLDSWQQLLPAFLTTRRIRATKPLIYISPWECESCSCHWRRHEHTSDDYLAFMKLCLHEERQRHRSTRDRRPPTDLWHRLPRLTPRRTGRMSDGWPSFEQKYCVYLYVAISWQLLVYFTSCDSLETHANCWQTMKVLRVVSCLDATRTHTSLQFRENVPCCWRQSRKTQQS